LIPPNAAELESNRRGIFTLDDRARRDLAGAVSKARDPEKALLAPVR
jgi:hypothetical protein